MIWLIPAYFIGWIITAIFIAKRYDEEAIDATIVGMFWPGTLPFILVLELVNWLRQKF